LLRVVHCNCSVLVRCDFNVPLKDSKIADDTRIRSSLPTIQLLASKGAKVVLCSHFGRPNGTGYDPKYTLARVAENLSVLLNQSVSLVADCVGDSVQQAVSQMSPGDVVLLENVRFHAEEEANDAQFAAQLVSSCGAEVYVNDAFGTAHRAHASTAGVAAHVPIAVAGKLLQKELTYLSSAVEQPKRPFAAIVGGSKVSSKIHVLESLLNKVDTLVIGGGMLFTFLKARGINVGASNVEEGQLDLARRIETLAAEKGVKLLLASDVVAADRFAADAQHKVVSIDAIPEGWLGLDVGSQTIATLTAALQDCQTVLWNGPLGVFEFPAFANGTHAVATALAELTAKGCVTIVGGGDSVAAVEQAGLSDKMSHISTGGGAALELLEGKALPGIIALNDA
jgi:phosphoglycerate kinase